MLPGQVLLKKQMLDEVKRAAAGGKRRANGAAVRAQDCLSGDGWYQQQARNAPHGVVSAPLHDTCCNLQVAGCRRSSQSHTGKGNALLWKAKPVIPCKCAGNLLWSG